MFLKQAKVAVYISRSTFPLAVNGVQYKGYFQTAR